MGSKEIVFFYILNGNFYFIKVKDVEKSITKNEVYS